jgi:hypothetical protein
VFYDDLAICVWDSREEVADGGINLSVVLRLGLRDWFRCSGRNRWSWLKHIKLCSRFLDNTLPDMVSYPVDLMAE